MLLKKILIVSAAVLACLCFSGPAAAAEIQPAEEFGSLFDAVEMERVFQDSKAFCDSQPKYPPREIMQSYRLLLEIFVTKHFDVPSDVPGTFKSDPAMPVEEHIGRLWPFLTRQLETKDGSSLISLPHPHIVPAGRFREAYYWDSYFIMLGLQAQRRVDMMENMVDNFAYLIDMIGFIPSGNRSYYKSRSQPPFFSLMVSLLAEERGDAVYEKYLPFLEKEYRFWMDGAEKLGRSNREERRVVLMPDGGILNRYWDDDPSPRPESYYQDVMRARDSDLDPRELYRNIRAAAESGWDCSNRWLAAGSGLDTIHTTHIIPVDLNALLYNLEMTLSKAHGIAGDRKKEQYYRYMAEQRMSAVNTYCWDKEDEFYRDYDFRLEKQTPVLSLAGMFPLFFRMADEDQAEAVADRIEDEFLGAGGLVTTLALGSRQQWDAPYGWAPLQWISVQGLRNYDHKKLAGTIVKRWVELNRKVYKNTGRMMEKYNVIDTTLADGGGEYPDQDGFGWTNGVFLKMVSEGTGK
ncbi:MAG: alpha,alpha-trehalase TreF [Deltaproteobacteria bacterium]|nr:alpha,alpha-trehalase TreF [Deltaproteobacteria bacterium]